MRSVVEIGASVPAFLGKLWKLVNDTETNHLISWSPGGKTFIIKNQADFARELLPLYYKHNNMASFIRQLNMYGFHKITSVENGGLRYEKDEIEFSHPCFMKGHAYLLEHIKRKIANPKTIVASSESGEKILLKPEVMNKVLADVKQMKGKQESLDAKFCAMKQENEALWREVAILRQKHIKQQQIVNNLIQFLMSLVQPTRPPNSNSNNVGVKRPYQLMINSAAYNSSIDGSYPGKKKNMKLDKDVLLEDLNDENLEDGPTIHELPHDDILHNEVSQDAMDPADFVTIEIDGIAPGSHNLSNPLSNIQYHVTMEDGEETDAGNNRVYPICHSNSIPRTTNETSAIASPSPTEVPSVSPIHHNNIHSVTNNIVTVPSNNSMAKTRGKAATLSPKSVLSPNNFNSLNPSIDLKLPAEIFASDDSISDTGVIAVEEPGIHNILHDSNMDSLASTSKDKMLGGINIKLEKPFDDLKKTKKSKKVNKDNVLNVNLNDIKTELNDDFDWNNMTLATVNSSPNVNRFQNRNRRDNISKNREEYSSLFGTNSNKNDIDDHLDAMQSDLESLRELLRSDSYAFDTNTLMGIGDSRIGPSMSLAIPSSHHASNDYLFGSDDPFYGLSYNTLDERTKTSNNNAKKLKGDLTNLCSEENHDQQFVEDNSVEGNQLISYTGTIPGFEDISIPDLESENSQDACVSPAPSSSTLNTPQVQTRSPSFTLKP